MAPKKHEEIIGRVLIELDEEHSTYQRLHRKYYGKDDLEAKHTYGLLVNLCERIKKEFDSLKGNNG